MRTCELGDTVQVHYVKRFQDGTVRSSRGRGLEPLEVTVGTDHRRLPGLGDGLVGLAPGKQTTRLVPADAAYGMPDSALVRRVARTRFHKDQALTTGRLARMRVGSGRTRVVRVVGVHDRAVVIDSNHPRCGQSVELTVELVAILTPAARPATP